MTRVNDKVALASTCRYLRNLVNGKDCSRLWQSVEFLTSANLESFFWFMHKINQYVRELRLDLFLCYKASYDAHRSSIMTDCSAWWASITVLFQKLPVLPVLENLVFTDADLRFTTMPQPPEGLASKIPRLKILRGARYSNRTLQEFTSGKPMLQEVDILCRTCKDRPCDDNDVDDDTLKKFLVAQENLHVVSGPQYLSFDVLTHWLSHPVNAGSLTHLRLARLDDDSMRSGVANCNNLVSLHVCGKCSRLTGSSLWHLGQLRKLCNLSLSPDVSRITSKEWSALFEAATFSLKTIALYRPYALNDEAVRYLVARNPDLEAIDIEGNFTGAGYRDINQLHKLYWVRCKSTKLDSAFVRSLDPVMLPNLRTFCVGVKAARDVREKDKRVICSRFPKCYVALDNISDSEDSDSDFYG